HAAETGAHAISSLPPAGNYSFAEVREYYEEVAAATALPFLVYYFPSIAPAIRTVDEILALCRIPNVAGLKFTDSDFFRLWAIRRTGAVVFNGFDEMLLPGLIMGANGGIGSTYNLIPASFVELYRLAAEGRWEEARRVQDSINQFIAVILRYPVHAAIKLALSWTGIDCGVCVPPRRTLSAAEAREFRTALGATELGEQLLEAHARA
ncbi:MAG: dihydrodipicolinate synthase family protein, partial [Acidobacteriota bacterium]|nr:dihydrodipicolinate synthase family protein [Acidobacteriota bacterium]